ncbi:MAG TPA: hypothetical protein VF041_23095 [Gemmatimonadaceae bacterium]
MPVPHCTRIRPIRRAIPSVLGLLALALAFAMSRPAAGAGADGGYYANATARDACYAGVSYRARREDDARVSFQYSVNDGATWLAGGDLGGVVPVAGYPFAVSVACFDGDVYVLAVGTDGRYERHAAAGSLDAYQFTPWRKWAP